MAAVSPGGTRGWSPNSERRLISTKTPIPPSRPRNLIDKLWRIFADGKITLELTWDESEHSGERGVAFYQVNFYNYHK